MSAVLGAEGSAGVLPVTGSGPFSIVVALIGVVSVVVGGLLRRVGRRRGRPVCIESPLRSAVT